MRASVFTAALVVALYGCGAASLPTGGDGRYAIAVVRRLPVGARWHTVLALRERRVTTLVVQNEALPPEVVESQVRLEADAEILALDEEGRPLRVRYVTSSLTTQAGASLAPGAIVEVVLAARGGDAVITCDGAACAPPVEEALREVLPLSRGATHGDALLGGGPPRAVAETWHPDMAEVAASVEGWRGFAIDPARSSATVTLRSHETRLGLPGVFVTGDFRSQGIAFPTPAGATARDTDLFVEFAHFLPDDVTRPSLSSMTRMHFVVTMDAATPAGPAVISFDAEREETRDNQPR